MVDREIDGSTDVADRTRFGKASRGEFIARVPDRGDGSIVHALHYLILMKYVAVSHRHNRIAAEGDGVVVMYNYIEGKKTTIPEEIRRRIAELEKS